VQTKAPVTHDSNNSVNYDMISWKKCLTELTECCLGTKDVHYVFFNLE